MRARRTAAAVLLLAAVTAGCRGEQNAGPLPPPTTAGTGVGATDAGAQVPSYDGRLRVTVTTALQVYGNGCRQLTARQLCSADGSKTYTVAGSEAPLTLTRATMRPNARHGAWVVSLRFDRAGGIKLQDAAAKAGGMGGYLLLVQQGTRNVLLAVSPPTVENGRITLADLAKPVAWDMVSTFVTSATDR